MIICTAKFKIRDAAEALFVTDMVERVKSIVAQYELPITHIRFGRQVKSWGSISVASYHVYRYKNTGKIELWINGHDADLTEEGRKFLEWSAILGCIMVSVKTGIEVDISAADVSFFALKYKYKNNTQLVTYLKERAMADKIAGTNYALVDAAREAQLLA